MYRQSPHYIHSGYTSITFTLPLKIFQHLPPYTDIWPITFIASTPNHISCLAIIQVESWAYCIYVRRCMYSNAHVCVREHTVMLTHVHCIVHSCTAHLHISFMLPTKQDIITKFHSIINRIILSQCIILYHSIPGKHPLPGKHPCSKFQVVTVVVSTHMYAIYIPGKRPRGLNSELYWSYLGHSIYL